MADTKVVPVETIPVTKSQELAAPQEQRHQDYPEYQSRAWDDGWKAGYARRGYVEAQRQGEPVYLLEVDKKQGLYEFVKPEHVAELKDSSTILTYYTSSPSADAAFNQGVEAVIERLVLPANWADTARTLKRPTDSHGGEAVKK